MGKNMMKASNTVYAVALVSNSNAQYTNYWTSMLSTDGKGKPVDLSCNGGKAPDGSPAPGSSAPSGGSSSGGSSGGSSSGKPACKGNHGTWASSYGKCSTYKPGGSNADWCPDKGPGGSANE